ncbi:MAG: GFA family protein [Myxococcales bacterium]|nr:GFA family protein [Myxococcales bacterium]
MSERRRYSGGCHCGQVRFEVTTELAQVMQCNCSICSKKGFLLSFVPESDFTLGSGQDALSEYRFNRHAVAHLFCKTCGIQSFGRGKGRDGSSMIALNVRCLDDVDVAKLAITEVDGKQL